MALTTLEEVKTLLSIPVTDTKKDALITALIPIVEDFIKMHCNNDFTDQDGVTSYPAGLKLPAAQLIKYQMEYKGVASEAAGDYSVSFLSNLPDGIKSMLRPYRKIKFI